jgi:CheY-like chemotaxis protein
MASVLVVEDDRDILCALEEALRSEGWEVVTAASAEEASTAGRSRAIDVVLCDVLLDDGNTGRHVEEAFARQPGLNHVPFAFMTASPREANRLSDHFVLRKPFATSEVVKLLNHALGDHPVRRSRLRA